MQPDTYEIPPPPIIPPPPSRPPGTPTTTNTHNSNNVKQPTQLYHHQHSQSDASVTTLQKLQQQQQQGSNVNTTVSAGISGNNQGMGIGQVNVAREGLVALGGCVASVRAKVTCVRRIDSLKDFVDQVNMRLITSVLGNLKRVLSVFDVERVKEYVEPSLSFFSGEAASNPSVIKFTLALLLCLWEIECIIEYVLRLIDGNKIALLKGDLKKTLELSYSSLVPLKAHFGDAFLSELEAKIVSLQQPTPDILPPPITDLPSADPTSVPSHSPTPPLPEPRKAPPAIVRQPLPQTTSCNPPISTPPTSPILRPATSPSPSLSTTSSPQSAAPTPTPTLISLPPPVTTPAPHPTVSGESFESIVESSLQNSLILQGYVITELTPTQPPGKYWVSNKPKLWKLRFFNSERDTDCLRTVDLTTALGLSINKKASKSQVTNRAVVIDLWTKSGAVVLQTQNEQEAVYWMIGIKRLLRDALRLQGEWRSAKNTLTTFDDDGPSNTSATSSTSSPAEEITLLQLDLDHSTYHLNTLLDKIEQVDASLTRINSVGERLWNEWVSVESQKESLTKERDSVSQYIEKIEFQLANRHGVNNNKKVPRTKDEVIPAPVWGNMFRKKRESIYCAISPMTAPPPETLTGGSAILDWMMSDNYSRVPPFRIAVVRDTPDLSTLEGPNSGPINSTCGNLVACKTISNYPRAPQKPGALTGTDPSIWENVKRMGDPICDHFCVRIWQTRVVAALADGCGWGVQSAEAATKASNAFVDYLSPIQHKITTATQAGDVLILALNAAESKITEHYSSTMSVGSTTFIGGILMESDDPRIKQPNPTTATWLFVFVSVGDCKAFLWSAETGTVKDITGNNRGGNDPTDPGGRLGPIINSKDPDLRNLTVQYQACAAGDLILLVTDGVHDNLDPEVLGDTPSTWRIQAPNWDTACQDNRELVVQVKTAFRQNLLKKVLEETPASMRASHTHLISPSNAADRLLNYAHKATSVQRKWMEDNPKLKTPCDYATYPGKLDHTSCVAICAGANPPQSLSQASPSASGLPIQPSSTPPLLPGRKGS
ncbi:cyclophilin B [Pelomyxa schiedti]|nr:cyclophilin B [Pelomyxa schiedti]